jgi:hypothetical protein
MLLVVVLGSWAAGEALDVQGLEHTTWYGYATSLLLAVGLFASTASIDRREAVLHKGLIFSAVTIGVILKAALIGGVLYLVTMNPLFVVLAVAVAQIDPLSVAAVLGDDRLSPRARTILASWASFDDPVTVLLVVYVTAVVGDSTAGVGASLVSGGAGWGLELGLNLALALGAFLAWRWLRRTPSLLALVLTGLAAVAVWQFLMLGVAVAGLFVRPTGLGRWLPRVTNGSLLIAGGLLGLLLINGVNIWSGLGLGVMAFVAQIVAGGLLTRGLPRMDRVHLALAQQNGITAIILALRLEADFVGSVAVIAPAILVTNTVHFVANWLVDRRHRSATR